MGGAGVGAGLSVTVTALHTHPVKAAVCLSRELGVMQPGQTVVELSADGVCHTSRCTDLLDPLTGFYQINTTSVLCDVHCEAVGGSMGRGEGGVVRRAGLAEARCSKTRGALQRPPSSLDKSRAWASGAPETSVESAGNRAGLGETRRGTAGVKAWQG